MNENTTKGETKMDKERIAELRAKLDALGRTNFAEPFEGWIGLATELLDALEAALARAEGAEAHNGEWESFRELFGDLTYHHQAMGCGVEGRGITARYEACEYGWNNALERAAEIMPEPRP